jgi:dipeptidyl-peptidase-4
MENTTPLPDSADPTVPLPLTLDDIYTNKIFEAPRLQQPHWMQDSLRFSYVDRAPDSETSTLWLYDVATGARTVVIPETALQRAPEDCIQPFPEPGEIEKAEPEPKDPEKARKRSILPIVGYQWSPDEKSILIANLPQRRASHGDVALFVYDVAAQTLRRVTPERHEYRSVKWSPDSRSLGYVREDDLYRLDLETGVETRLTDTARAQLYNGRLGWVYEEEVELADGWAWSPDGRRIAYFQQDESQVPQIELPNYDALHMTPHVTRYPKAGDPNPLVKIGVLDLPAAGANAAVPKTRWIDLGADTDIYIYRMQWTPDSSHLLLQRIPRLQNRLDLLLADPHTGATTVVLTEEDPAWVDTPGEVTFVKETDQFLWLSDRSGWRHLYRYDLSGKLHGAVTTGEWDVERLAAIDAPQRLIYFTAARPSALERQVFRATLEDGEIAQVSTGRGYHAPLFAPDAAHYLDTHSSRSAPPEVTLHRANGDSVATILINPMPKRQGRKTGEWSFTTFETSDGVTLNASLLYPVDFDPTRKYPVLMYTYGGPGSQVVLDTYGSGGGLEQWLAQEGYLLAMVDGRGSGMRGRDFKKVTYLKLGDYEVNDQIEGAKWLAGLPFVDAARVGIWGWSYGGYMASLCILRGADVFRVAVAVAPVTHWTLYDSIYTERYMRRPVDNPDGYASTSPLTLADSLKGKFLLVHGTADDNVHFQNAARLAAALQKGNKPFQTMFYPGKHHGIEGVSLHVFSLITTFIKENL